MHNLYTSSDFNVQESLLNFVKQQGLIDKQRTQESLSTTKYLIDQPNFYLGTGLCSAKHLSVAVPYDILSMVLMAIAVQKQIAPKANIYHTIADNHAGTNHFDKLSIAKIAAMQKNVLESVIELSGMNDYYKVSLASEYQHERVFTEIHAAFALDKHPYVQAEVADIEYHYQQKKVGFKFGWAIPGRNEESRDEVFFDNEYNSAKQGAKVGFIYVAPGKTLDNASPNKPPYTCMPGQESTRVLIRPGENAISKVAAAKCSDGTKNAYTKYLAHINRLFTKATGIKLPGKSVEENVNQVIALLINTMNEKTKSFTKN